MKILEEIHNCHIMWKYGMLCWGASGKAEELFVCGANSGWIYELNLTAEAQIASLAI